MSRIAICFLVTKNVVNMRMWEDWWAGHEDKINIYSHFSHAKGITQPILLDNRVHAVPTKWGTISLMYAEAELYKEALKDRRNAFVVLMSDTCIPVRTFAYTYGRLMRVKAKGILAYRRLDPLDREDASPFAADLPRCEQKMDDFGLFGDKLYASDQWKALSRKNAYDFVRMFSDKDYVDLFTRCIRVVPDSLAPDELMYVNYMYHKYGNLSKHFRGGQITYVDFTGKAIHPITYTEITSSVRREICGVNTLFVRKFPGAATKKLRGQVPVTCRRGKPVKSAKSTPRSRRRTPKSRTRTRKRKRASRSRRRTPKSRTRHRSRTRRRTPLSRRRKPSARTRRRRA